MSLDVDAVQTALVDVAQVLRADGGDIVVVEVDARRDRVSLRLELSGVTCADCIVAPDLLRDVVSDALQRGLHRELEVLLEDPRR